MLYTTLFVCWYLHTIQMCMPVKVSVWLHYLSHFLFNHIIKICCSVSLISAILLISLLLPSLSVSLPPPSLSLSLSSSNENS